MPRDDKLDNAFRWIIVLMMSTVTIILAIIATGLGALLIEGITK